MAGVHTDYILAATFPAAPTAEAHAQPAWVLLAYLVAGVCFILALRGLSSPSTSQRGNRLGMIGMAIAVVTTLLVAFGVGNLFGGSADETRYLVLDQVALLEILAAIGIGAVIGIVTARRIKMTDMPQLVAAFHSLVGLAAVLVGAAAFLNPEAFGIAAVISPIASAPVVNILPVSRLEQAEKLEQLRALEAGIGIACAVVEHAMPGIDVRADYDAFLERHRAKCEVRGAK